MPVSILSFYFKQIQNGITKPLAGEAQNVGLFSNFTTENGLPLDGIHSAIMDKNGNLWFGTAGGASRFDGKSFTNFTTDDGLPDNIVSQVATDYQGNIVFGTNDGLAMIISFIPKDKPDNLNGGLTAQNNLTNSELKAFLPRMNTYNLSTGYPVKDVNLGQIGIFSDSKGILWIGTGSDKTGLVRFDPSAVNTNPSSPVVFIQSIKINNEKISWIDLRKA